MNDVVTTSKTTEEDSTEVRDFVELGEVSEDTKGLSWGNHLDGGLSTFFLY